jgi:hypothetical protein
MSGNYAECDALYRNKLIAVRAPNVNTEDTICSPACGPDGDSSTNANIVMIDGATDADGMYRIDNTNPVSNLTRITQFTPSDNSIWPLKPKWSPDCTMIAFLAWDRTPNNDNPTPPSKTSVYIINLDSNAAGFVKKDPNNPIKTLSDPGVYKIYDYSSRNMPAYVPNWSADGKLVSYSVDMTYTLNLENVNNGMENIVQDLFSGSNYDSYLEYILDQPDSKGAIFSPQLIGQVQYNELNLTQCPSYIGSACRPTVLDTPNTPYVQVSQLSNGTGAYLRMVTLGDTSDVSTEGGLLFQDGIVTAVFPPNALASNTVLFNTTPPDFCPVVGHDCPPDPTTNYIVQAGEARNFFPDGTNFKSYVRLIFHYCDNDNGGLGDGKVDAGTEVGGKAMDLIHFNPIDNKCYHVADNSETTGGTVDVDTLAVYNWDYSIGVNGAWVKLDGIVDKTSKTITVFASHFSRYDTLGFRMGFAPAALTPLQIIDLHTYPNPYVESQNRADGIRFAAADVVAGAGEAVSVEIKIYDLRGSLVNTLAGSINESDPHENGAHTVYAWKPVANAAGRPLASGVYMYYLTARTANYTVTQKGSFSVVR